LDFSGVFPRLPRGCLIGVAAALKLTPAFLIVYLLVVRRFRAAGVAASTFLLVSLAAFAFGPSTSWRYWFHGYFADARRTGDVQYISNQSLNGVLVRLTGGPAHARSLWLVSAVATTICLLWLSRRAHGARPWLGEALAMSGMLLVSPVSWVHHWIIVLPLLIASFRCAAEAASRTRVALVTTTVALSAVLLFGVVWRVPIGNERVYHADAVQFLLGNSQVLLLLAVIASLAVFVVHAPRSDEVISASTHAPRINPVAARSPSRPGLNTR
jgi:alpha-1,2-mannosyltransferase